MENTIVCIHDYLSVKSQARMRSVSKFFKDNIVVKKYSFYQKFKKVKDTICRCAFIEMIFEMDQEFINDEMLYAVYYPIENHKYGDNLKDYIKSSGLYSCILHFEEVVEAHGKEPDFDLVNEICDHCEEYTKYRPLQSALIQICYEQHSFN